MQKGKIGLKHIALVSESDPIYQLYLSRYKTEKKEDVVYNKPARKKSETMGFLLELAVKDWAKKSPFFIEEKIISYQFTSSTDKKWKELDYVLKQGGRLIIGEVKTSSSSKGRVVEACKQLSYSKELLSHISNSVTMQIIRIDLNFKNATEPFDEFNQDFQKSKFRTYEWGGQKFQLLYLCAQDVFNYGVENKIIKSPEIFEPAVYETNLLHQRRQTKELLKEKNKELIEISNVDELENIQNEIGQLQGSVFHYDIKINLSHQGYDQIQNKSEEEYKSIINELGERFIPGKIEDSFCERTNGFSMDDPNAKYITYYNGSNQEVEFNLLDAERVYLRLSDEQQSELQSINFVAENTLQEQRDSLPLLRKFPYRKFYYSNTLLREEDGNNKSLQQFEHVVRQSEPVKVLLNPGDILIFDNHRMLHRNCIGHLEGLVKSLVL